MKIKPLYEYSSDVYSQNGEDGIITFLFDLLKINKGLMLEVGANDGVWCSNTRSHYTKNENFKALLIEGDGAGYNKLLSNCEGMNNTEKVQCFISPNSDDASSLDEIIKISQWKEEPFVLCSIDIDGLDYEVWKNLKARPTLVIIECPIFLENHSEKKNILQYVQLGETKNYSFLGMSGKLNSHAGNLIFLANEFMDGIELPEVHERILLHNGALYTP